jgi:hypothetical protein
MRNIIEEIDKKENVSELFDIYTAIMWRLNTLFNGVGIQNYTLRHLEKCVYVINEYDCISFGSIYIDFNNMTIDEIRDGINDSSLDFPYYIESDPKPLFYDDYMIAFNQEYYECAIFKKSNMIKTNWDG